MLIFPIARPSIVKVKSHMMEIPTKHDFTCMKRERVSKEPVPWTQQQCTTG